MKNLFFFLNFLIFSQFALGQDQSSYSFSFNHLALSVKDVDKSASFYKNVLKLSEIENKAKIPGIRWFSLGEGKEIHLISVIPGDIVINKAVHIALTSADFDAFVMSLDKQMIPYSDWPGTTGTINIRADGIKQIFFQDPDGYWIEVNSVK